MNFIFISPNYPENYWMFCRGLKKYGAKVLAIVDAPYDSLRPELKQNVDECYVVQSFHNYDEMLKAVAYFTFKYGKIDWIESNNEAWLALDARLRDDFNVRSGFSLEKINEFQSKAAMKKYYEKAGVPVARYCLPRSLEEAKAFAEQIGFPLVLKPDHGVGASFTYSLYSMEDLEKYYENTKDLCMILEEYVKGDVITLDGICDAQGKIRFLGSMEYVGNCMESVLNQDSIGCFYTFNISEEYRQIAQNVIDAFELKNRFFHGEYFRLTEDIEGLGKKGTLIGLEVNFRPPGGFAPDLMNYSNDIDVYELWAEVLLRQSASYSKLRKFSAGFAGRRDCIPYRYNTQEIETMFNDEHLGTELLPPAYAATMGNVTIKARFTSNERREEFFKTALERLGD
ncbi:acetyl-CoA carboxylase biotin carboxylase subunit family protein [Dubosiella muris]|uniref:ATP-grasp domain-containing protein n=1 Tax=Dubosiella muris TaxID=3038133 RepID=A0AC61R8S7_9FIRM|nr:ATP-grasp domain-containing protein [Dubosiella muris]TGY66316.1 ATP-grasp domain-containing protein [Dubosiella muris]